MWHWVKSVSHKYHSLSQNYSSLLYVWQTVTLESAEGYFGCADVEKTAFQKPSQDHLKQIADNI